MFFLEMIYSKKQKMKYFGHPVLCIMVIDTTCMPEQCQREFCALLPDPRLSPTGEDEC